MTVELLRAEDVALLCAEPREAQLQIGALCFFEAAALRDQHGRLRVAELRSHIDSRLDALPRFRQRVAPVLAGVSTPVWVDDAEFDIARHTPHVELPAPGRGAALRTFMAGLLSQPMDRAHPLWDIHFVEGIDDDVIAIVVRAHHVMADGIALHEAAMLLLGTTPQPSALRPRRWSPEPVGCPLRLCATSLSGRARRQMRLAVDLTRELCDPRHVAPNVRLATRLVGGLRNLSLSARPFPLTGPVGRRRDFAWDSLPMADIVAVKRACGVTVNDVVLAIATGALRRELEASDTFDRGRPEPRALIPIGSYNPADRVGNRFSITNVALPVGVDDPLERVALLHARMDGRVSSPAQSFIPHVFSIADVVPVPALRALAPRVLARQPLVDLAVSNIPGSREPQYMWDSRLLRLSPFITGVGNIALVIGVLSYVDGLGVGITVDPDVVGDPERILSHMRSAASELAALVR
ncbi:MAG: wax ester/triacylglycerol synthase family O-acyltransferase [Acidimicrobiia bacterium]